jgi:hypothetical protein
VIIGLSGDVSSLDTESVANVANVDDHRHNLKTSPSEVYVRSGEQNGEKTLLPSTSSDNVTHLNDKECKCENAYSTDLIATIATNAPKPHPERLGASGDTLNGSPLSPLNMYHPPTNEEEKREEQEKKVNQEMLSADKLNERLLRLEKAKKLRPGDPCVYVGDKPFLIQHYGGKTLKFASIGLQGTANAREPSGRITTWVPLEDLQPIEDDLEDWI